MVNDDFSEPPRRTDSKNPIFISLPIFGSGSPPRPGGQLSPFSGRGGSSQGALSIPPPPNLQLEARPPQQFTGLAIACPPASLRGGGGGGHDSKSLPCRADRDGPRINGGCWLPRGTPGRDTTSLHCTQHIAPGKRPPPPPLGDQRAARPRALSQGTVRDEPRGTSQYCRAYQIRPPPTPPPPQVFVDVAAQSTSGPAPQGVGGSDAGERTPHDRREG